MSVLIGVNIGQRWDPTAVCVAEPVRSTAPGLSEAHVLVRHLARLPLGTPYPEIVHWLGELAARVARRTGEPPVIYVDAAGVGKPVVDLLREGACDARIVPFCFTRGDRRTVAGSEVRLGKAHLTSRLQSLLETGRVHLPRTSEARALEGELLDYEIRLDENAHDRDGAFRVGTP